MGCCSMKTWTWLVWFINTIISVVYIGLALSSFHSIRSGTDKLDTAGQDKVSVDAYKNSLLAACFLGFSIVLFFVIFSFLILISRSFADVKLAWGFMLGTALHTAWFQLLAGLVLQTSRTTFKTFVDSGIWNDGEYKTYEATYTFSYIMVALYIFMFIVLLFARKYVGRGIVEQPAAGSAPSNHYTDMATMKPGSMSARVNQV